MGDLLESNCQEYDAKKFANKLSGIFLQFFVYLFGKYRDFVNGDDFDREAFINSQSADTHAVCSLLVLTHTHSLTHSLSHLCAYPHDCRARCV